MPLFPYAPITKDAENYGLQGCLGYLVSFCHVVVLGFPCLYFALLVVVRQSRFALLLPLALSFIDDFTARIFPLHTHIT